MFDKKPPRPMTKSLRVLAALLGYPDAPMRSHLPEMRELLREERALSAARLAELDALMEALGRADPLEAESDYVELFDRGRGTSLHLFEHVHGDSRERGPAMIDLGQTYEKAGLVLTEGELPDYLPAVLEFVSTQPVREAKAFLGEMSHIFNAIFNALQHRESAYASVLGALIELAGEQAQAVASIRPPVEEPLDESWAEPVVFDGCSSKGQAKPGQAQPVHIVRQSAPRPTTTSSAPRGGMSKVAEPHLLMSNPTPWPGQAFAKKRSALQGERQRRDDRQVNGVSVAAVIAAEVRARA